MIYYLRTGRRLPGSLREATLGGGVNDGLESVRRGRTGKRQTQWAWVFVGTRVPVSALFENLKDGASVEQFLEWFPGVDSWKVQAVLDHEVKSLADAMRS